MTRPPRVVLSLAICLLASLLVERVSSRQAESPAPAANIRSVSFSPSDDNFPNPERGFYWGLTPFPIGTGRTPVDAQTLAAIRAQGITLIRAYYVLDEFRDGPLSRAALDAINLDFVTIRQSGLKVIPRFTYNFPCLSSLEPCGAAAIAAQAIDPPLSRVLEHIDQLTPGLRAGSDVIAFMEMGFVGAWGEWHNSSSGLVNPNRTLNTSSAAIVDRVLLALADNRMAALRYPYHKQALVGSGALEASEAFNGTARARLGAHNDCFLASADDLGTYAPPVQVAGVDNVEALHEFLNLDNRFVPQGGETCSAGVQAQPYIGCDNALSEFRRLRWSTINIGFHPSVIDLWRQQGCFADVQKRLGYRFRLVTADVPEQVQLGRSFTMQMTVTNDGWAAPFNPRAVEIILRHAVTGRLSVFPVDADPRFWGAGETQTITISAMLSSAQETGPYEVLLNMPDPEPDLRWRPDYAIRLANQNVWEPDTGYNDLQTVVMVARADVAVRLLPGGSVRSNNGRYLLAYQTDGNLVLYDDSNNTALWASHTAGLSPGLAVMQTDGNFVVYDNRSVAVWSSGTPDNPNAYLAIQDDGALVIYTENQQPIWDSRS